MNEDQIEWIETFEQLEVDAEIVLSELSFGEIVSMKKGFFDSLIKEVNDSRIKNGDLGNGIELILVSEDEDN